MARPVNANADETRGRILHAAIGLFAGHGFHGASTRELAALANVNVATISYYFGGKQGLYEATVDEVYRRLADRTQAALASASLNDVGALIGGLYAAARSERDGVRVLVREVLDHGRLTPHTEAKHFLPGVGKLSELAAGALGCSPAHALTGIVALGYLLSRYVIQDDASLKAALGARTAKEAHQRVVATLVATARALLSPSKKD